MLLHPLFALFDSFKPLVDHFVGNGAVLGLFFFMLDDPVCDLFHNVNHGFSFLEMQV